MGATCVFTALKKGNKASNQTKILQQKLKDLGYYKGLIDGVFGDLTDSALRSYQKVKGLVVDGIAGQITCTSMQIWCSVPTPSTKICNGATTFIMQPNNYTCGVTCLRMAGSRHGSIPSYNDVMKYTGCNSNNGTGHSGMKNTLLNLMGYQSAVSLYRKDLSLDGARDKIKQGYDVFINLMTGGLSGWGGNWPHWVLVQCIDDEYVWINDPDRGAMIRHDRDTMEQCMDNNSNPDYVIALKK